jgi:hypothetical protein
MIRATEASAIMTVLPCLLFQVRVIAHAVEECLALEGTCGDDENFFYPASRATEREPSAKGTIRGVRLRVGNLV